MKKARFFFLGLALLTLTLVLQYSKWIELPDFFYGFGLGLSISLLVASVYAQPVVQKSISELKQRLILGTKK